MLRARTRRLLALLGVGYVAACLVIGFWPSPVDRPIDYSLLHVLAYLHSVGVPDVVDYSFVERTANVLLFVPLGALVAAQLNARQWWIALSTCVALSGVIELGQALLLPARYASWIDLLANSVGAAIGVSITMLLRRRTRDTTSR
ncbi:VanZ family protein [Glaciihabitans sp. INWT7]|uniref:VanZ family protein n=1 Tax=Glaciihabitans sp. INWT7 TaxID=2596912 RepID=UPI0016276BC4|nr:VanZ family protein [Glaciihabitans sp. INWT7]QNE47633.1 VanZ family protein [Glaciihabitans sp. INWT7]